MTTLQAAYPIITITGTLTANSTLIVPSQVGEWIFSNKTTGAYTLTVKTAAGTGVVITTGSSQYTWSDGTNVYFANASSVTSFNTRTGAIVLNSTDVTSALGFTPYNATNPAGYITAPIGLGWGGTSWQNITSSRASGTLYTNSMPYPIMVSITYLYSATITDLMVYVNGINILIQDGAAVNIYENSASFIVPSGNTYQVNIGNLITIWAELR